ncbi:MAG: prepilin-type N-terminal cleavage/methylation domain-containing protein [Gemmatimonadota bacterium]|nr:MAG: prepilin-type N-terminal cleavage/methylation domain-containing protein [Gemmatimonadota bacterium]
MRSLRAFTLIELLVVVVIISILGAIAVPVLLSKLENAAQEHETEQPSQPISQAPPSAEVVSGPDEERGRHPVFESTEVQFDLRSSHVLEQFRVHTRYNAVFNGTFVIRNVDQVIDSITLRFPFPPGISEARDVSLKFRDSQGQLQESLDASYTLDGIEWTGKVPPGETVTAVVSYAAQGSDALVYDVAGRGRSGSVSVDLRLHDAPRSVVPPRSLQPVERDGDRLRWQFASLVTSKPIVVELPAVSSPLGRVILLMQLAGLAVLFFGGGFWYLSEEQRPGRLDDFRWGHFLLLALNYSLFFGILAVLGYRGSALVALLVAGAVSLPLLMLHVARVTDLSFALTRVLPLVVLTLGTVVAAVFLDEHRAVVFLGAAIVVVAFPTVTYSRWSGRRQAYVEEEKSRREQSAQQNELREQLAGLRQLVEKQELLRFNAGRALEEAALGFDAERAEVRRSLESYEKAVTAGQEAIDTDISWDGMPAEEVEMRRRSLLGSVEKATRLIQVRSKALNRTVEALESAAEDTAERLRRHLGALEGALGEAAALEVEARSLLEDSPVDLERERTALEGSLQRLQEACVEAEGFREQEQQPRADLDVRSRASTADRHARAVATHTRTGHEALDRLRQSGRQALERVRLEEGGTATAHCLACGFGLAAENSFCPNCGTPRPLELECPACGLSAQLPRHLLGYGWRKKSLYCGGCGAEMPQLNEGEPADDRAGA